VVDKTLTQSLSQAMCYLLNVDAQGSATRATDDSVRPDLRSLSISMQHSMSADAHSSQSRRETHSSAPVISAAEAPRIGYSAAVDFAASGYSRSSQTLLDVQCPYAYTPSPHVTEAASRLFGPTVIESGAEEPRPARPAKWPTTSAQDNSRLAVVPGRDNECDETEDESSMLSVSVNRLV